MQCNSIQRIRLLMLLNAGASEASFLGDLVWLAHQSRKILHESCFRATHGSLDELRLSNLTGCLFKPNGGTGYKGQFTRDYTYAVLNIPWSSGSSAWLDGFTFATESILNAQRSDGLVPDSIDVSSVGFNNCSAQACTFSLTSPLPRPQCCSRYNCSIGSMDNAAFITLNVVFLASKLEQHRGHKPGGEFLSKHLDSLLRGLANVPRTSSHSLAFNNADDPILGYGFEDSITKTGALHYASLLLIEAEATLCNATRHFHHHVGMRASNISARLCANAKRVALAIRATFWNEFQGMLRPSTGLESNLTDFWGSAYAAFLDGQSSSVGLNAWPEDVPSVLPVQHRKSVARFLETRRDAIFIAGQARHLPMPQSWVQQWCVPYDVMPHSSLTCRTGWLLSEPGTYQNGGAWSIALQHMLPVLHMYGSTSLACTFFKDFISNARDQDSNIAEWVDAEGSPRGAVRYVASAASAFAGAHRILQNGGCSDGPSKQNAGDTTSVVV